MFLRSDIWDEQEDGGFNWFEDCKKYSYVNKKSHVRSSKLKGCMRPNCTQFRQIKGTQASLMKYLKEHKMLEEAGLESLD